MKRVHEEKKEEVNSDRKRQRTEKKQKKRKKRKRESDHSSNRNNKKIKEEVKKLASAANDGSTSNSDSSLQLQVYDQIKNIDTLKVLFWNIQHLGGGISGRKRHDPERVKNVAEVIETSGADVSVIVEVMERRGGRQEKLADEKIADSFNMTEGFVREHFSSLGFMGRDEKVVEILNHIRDEKEDKKIRIPKSIPNSGRNTRSKKRNAIDSQKKSEKESKKEIDLTADIIHQTYIHQLEKLEEDIIRLEEEIDEIPRSFDKLISDIKVIFNNKKNISHKRITNKLAKISEDAEKLRAEIKSDEIIKKIKYLADLEAIFSEGEKEREKNRNLKIKKIERIIENLSKEISIDAINTQVEEIENFLEDLLLNNANQNGSDVDTDIDTDTGPKEVMQIARKLGNNYSYYIPNINGKYQYSKGETYAFIYKKDKISVDENKPVGEYLDIYSGKKHGSARQPYRLQLNFNKTNQFNIVALHAPYVNSKFPNIRKKAYEGLRNREDFTLPTILALDANSTTPEQVKEITDLRKLDIAYLPSTEKASKASKDRAKKLKKPIQSELNKENSMASAINSTNFGKQPQSYDHMMLLDYTLEGSHKGSHMVMAAKLDHSVPFSNKKGREALTASQNHQFVLPFQAEIKNLKIKESSDHAALYSEFAVVPVNGDSSLFFDSTEFPKNFQEQLVLINQLPEVKCSDQDNGNCLFKAIAEGIFSDEGLHENLRLSTSLFIYNRRDEFKDFISEENIRDYVANMARNNVWGGGIELAAMAVMLHVKINVYTLDNNGVVEDNPSYTFTPDSNADGDPGILDLIYYNADDASGDPNHYQLLSEYDEERNKLASESKDTKDKGKDKEE